MYVSTFKIVALFSTLAVFLILGITFLAVYGPKSPPEEKTYVDLYRTCMFNETEESAPVCKELVIKEIEKDESTSTKSN